MQFEHKGNQVSIEALSNDTKPSPIDTNSDGLPDGLGPIVRIWQHITLKQVNSLL